MLDKPSAMVRPRLAFSSDWFLEVPEVNVLVPQDGLPSMSWLHGAEVRPSPAEAKVLLPALELQQQLFRNLPEAVQYLEGAGSPAPIASSPDPVVDSAALLLMADPDLRIADLNQARYVARSANQGDVAPERRATLDRFQGE